MQASRRQFFKICAGGMAGTTAAALGFTPSIALTETRQYKLLRTRETCNTCIYCFVGYGLLMYSLGDGTKNAKTSILHIEGDPDYPINRGALCPKGAGLVNFIHSESRLKFPEYRVQGSGKWQQISWEEAFDRIVKLVKEDCDVSYIAQNAEGVTVNRWPSTGILCVSASSNETGHLTQKFSRVLGMLAVDNQARVRHRPAVVNPVPTFGHSAMTNHWVDIKNASLVVMMGGNAVEAHLVRFRQAMEVKIHNGAKLTVIDPCLTCTATVVDYYAPIRSGTDITFLSGVLLYLLNSEKSNCEYTETHTNVSLIVYEDYGFEDGLLTGYDVEKRKYDKSTWIYELDENGSAKRGTTL